MDSSNAVNSSQLSEQMNTATFNEVHASISADPGRPADIPEIPNADQTGTPVEGANLGSERVTVIGKSRFGDIC